MGNLIKAIFIGNKLCRPNIDITNMVNTSEYTFSPDAQFGASFSPDGKKVFLGCRYSGVIRKDLSIPFNLNSAINTYTENPGGEIHQVYLSPDGTKVAFASYTNGYIGMRTLTTPRDFTTRTNYKTASFSKCVGVSFSSDGTMLYVSFWQNNSSIIQYRLGTARDITSSKTQVGVLGIGYETRGVSFSTDGLNLLNTATDQTLRQYKLTTPRDINTAYLYKSINCGANMATFLGDNTGYTKGSVIIKRII